MTVISVAASTVVTRLKANGLSAGKAQLVQRDLAAAVKASGGGADGTSAAFARSALDKRIADDVKSGQLSMADAAKVTRTLDQIDAQPSASATPAAANDGDAPQQASATAGDSAGAGRAGGGGHGGGGGGGGATKTELSRLVTVSGPIKTTIITYTDGSSDTQTSTASASDQMRYDRSGKSTGSGDVVKDYLATISPGTLVRKAA